MIRDFIKTEVEYPLPFIPSGCMGVLFLEVFSSGLVYFFWYSALERKDSIPVCCRNALPPGGGEVLWGDMKNLDI